MESPYACADKKGDCTRAHCIICDTHAGAERCCSTECYEAFERVRDALAPWDGGYMVGYLGDWQGYIYEYQVTKRAAIDKACEYARKYGKFTNVKDRPEPEFRQWLDGKIEQVTRGEYEQIDLLVGELHFLIWRDKH